MKFRLPIAFVLLVVTGMVSCKKGSDGPQQAVLQPITFKFGQDATPVIIDQATQTLKNMPRSCDVKQLVATAVLPSGFSISPDATIAKDYTKGVTYTITTNEGKTYTV